jgi:hypothetical protein
MRAVPPESRQAAHASAFRITSRNANALIFHDERTAGPPSQENPGIPVPATVEITPRWSIMRTTLPDASEK